MGIEIRHMAPLLQVFDMPTAIAFYHDTLGFEVKLTDGKPVPDNDWVLLERDDIQFMLNTAYERDDRPAARDGKRQFAHQDTCLYFACPDTDGAYAYLREKGVDCKPPKVAPYGMKQLYIRDPDGYAICFQWRAEKQASAE